MKASVARNIKAFLRKRLRFFDLRHMRRPAVGIGGESASVSMAHVTPGKDRSDLRYHLVDRDWDVFVGRHPVLLFAGGRVRVLPWMPQGWIGRSLKRPLEPVRHHPKAISAAPTTVSVLTAVSAVW
jgi:hypothetical protein